MFGRRREGMWAHKSSPQGEKDPRDPVFPRESQLQHDFSYIAVEPKELLNNMGVWHHWGVEPNLAWCKYFMQKPLVQILNKKERYSIDIQVENCSIQQFHTETCAILYFLLHSHFPSNEETISLPLSPIGLVQVQLDTQISM